MRLYNTMTRKKEEFIPIKEGEVSFYVCGPTVYNHIHIGNARTFISFDVIRRYLEFSGYRVTFVQNITDVDDKIINRAAEEGTTPEQVAEQYTQAFVEVMDALGIKPPSVRPKATEELAEMVALIEQLLAAGHAYEVEGDVYFEVRSFGRYGLLSGRDIDRLLSGARVDVDERKRDALDFALWKAAKPGEPAWDSPWGPGRPGWHIECSAMSRRYLGSAFDIHGGGEDLVFPHHENEIAQSQAAGDQFARYWLHSGMLTIDQEKMSKSLGNFMLLKDVLQQVRPQALRLLMLQSHYRSPFDYSPERLDEAEAALGRVLNSLRNLDWAAGAAGSASGEAAAPDASGAPVAPDASGVPAAPADAPLLEAINQARARFSEQMDDDFNTAGAVAAIYDLVSEANAALAAGCEPASAAAAAEAVREMLAVLGVDLYAVTASSSEDLPEGLVGLASQLADYQGDNPAQAADALLELRAQARAAKDWAAADAVRDGLTGLGLAIEDTPSGTRVFKA